MLIGSSLYGLSQYYKQQQLTKQILRGQEKYLSIFLTFEP